MKPALETQNRPTKRSPFAMLCTVNRAHLKPNSGTSVYVAVDLTPSAAASAGPSGGKMKQALETQNRPAKRSPFAMQCTVNRAHLKPNSGTSVYVAVDLTPSAAAIAGRNRSISLAIDSSGSMDGEKIDQAKAAALGLLKQLRPTDQISIVSFSDTVTVQLPMSRVGNSREAAAAATAISVGGLTAMYNGLDATFQQARRGSQEAGTVTRGIALAAGNPTVGNASRR